MILDIIDPEKFLKFGYPGLVSIFALLLFYLFRNQLKGQLSNKDFLIRIVPFIVVTILLLAMAGFSIYTDKTVQKDKYTNDLLRTIDSLNTELLIATGKSPTTLSLQKKYENITHQNDSLDKLINSLQAEVKKKDQYLNENIMVGIVESLEGIIENTGSKGRLDPSGTNGFNEKILKNAIFQNVIKIGADTSVLRNALLSLQKRGLKFNLTKVINEAPLLFQLRRSWLKLVILKLETEIQNLGPKQESASINIELPKEVWIIEKPYIVHFDQNQLSSLEDEQSFLKKKTL